ncbi:subtilase family AB5 toxin binding subunit [Citrobacter freundii]|uniref:subtilase family AB5 toxin binding subunit n=1 Tax=Citrobacter freundii TaxID=546 RepID=UPI00383ACA4E
MNIIKSTISSLLLFFVFSINANANSWYLKDAEQYENMRISNVFFAPYEHSPRICAYFSAVDGDKSRDITACAVADNGYYVKNRNGTGAYNQMYDMVKYFYTTGESISVYVRKNEFGSFDSSISKHELVGIGTCNGWCFGEKTS